MPKGTPLGEFEQLVVLAILRLGTNAYGVTIRGEIVACARRQVSPGALYTTLERLERKGALHSAEGAPTPERGFRAKRFYGVTEAGRLQLVEAQRSFQRMMAGSGAAGRTAWLRLGGRGWKPGQSRRRVVGWRVPGWWGWDGMRVVIVRDDLPENSLGGARIAGVNVPGGRRG